MEKLYYAFVNLDTAYLVYAESEFDAWEILQSSGMYTVFAVSHDGFASIDAALEFQPMWADILRVM